MPAPSTWAAARCGAGSWWPARAWPTASWTGGSAYAVATSRPCRPNRPSRGLAVQGAAHGTELDLGLRELGGGIRARYDAAPGEQAGGTAGQLRAAQRDAPLAVAVRVHPADRAGVTFPVHVLALPDELQ